MKIEKRYYSADEVIDIIKDKWCEGFEVVSEYVHFIENVKMKPSEKSKLINNDGVGLLYSAYDDYF